MTEREKHDFNKGEGNSKETIEPPVKKPKILEPLRKGEGKPAIIFTITKYQHAKLAPG